MPGDTSPPSDRTSEHSRWGRRKNGHVEDICTCVATGVRSQNRNRRRTLRKSAKGGIAGHGYMRVTKVISGCRKAYRRCSLDALDGYVFVARKGTGGLVSRTVTVAVFTVTLPAKSIPCEAYIGRSQWVKGHLGRLNQFRTGIDRVVDCGVERERCSIEGGAFENNRLFAGGQRNNGCGRVDGQTERVRVNGIAARPEQSRPRVPYRVSPLDRPTWPSKSRLTNSRTLVNAVDGH